MWLFFSPCGFIILLSWTLFLRRALYTGQTVTCEWNKPHKHPVSPCHMKEHICVLLWIIPKSITDPTYKRYRWSFRASSNHFKKSYCRTRITCSPLTKCKIWHIMSILVNTLFMILPWAPQTHRSALPKSYTLIQQQLWVIFLSTEQTFW